MRCKRITKTGVELLEYIGEEWIAIAGLGLEDMGICPDCGVMAPTSLDIKEDFNQSFSESLQQTCNWCHRVINYEY